MEWEVRVSRIFEHTELMDYNDFMNKSADVSSAKAYEEDFIVETILRLGRWERSGFVVWR